MLSLQTVTTLSGREAQIQAGDVKTVVNGIKWPLPPGLLAAGGGSTNNSPGPNYLTDSILLGSLLDIVPTVQADGFTTELSLTATVSDFLGYDVPGNPAPVTKPSAPSIPLPHYRLRTLQTGAKVRHGETLLLANPKIIEFSGQTEVKPMSKPGERKSILLVFVTTTLIDSAGNPIHFDDSR